MGSQKKPPILGSWIRLLSVELNIGGQYSTGLVEYSSGGFKGSSCISFSAVISVFREATYTRKYDVDLHIFVPAKMMLPSYRILSLCAYRW